MRLNILICNHNDRYTGGHMFLGNEQFSENFMKCVRLVVVMMIASFSLTAFAWHHHGWYGNEVIFPVVVPVTPVVPAPVPAPVYYHPSRCQRFHDCLHYYGYYHNRYRICVNQFNGDPCRLYYYY